MATLLQGLSKSEAFEVFLAQIDFDKQVAKLQTSEAEQTDMEERQAESERLLQEIEEQEKSLAKLTQGKHFYERKGGSEKRVERANKAEEHLNELRLKLAQTNPIGSNLFAEDNRFTEQEQMAFDASIRAGLKLLRQRAQKIERKIQEKKTDFE